MNKKKQLLIALLIYFLYAAVLFLSNVFGKIGVSKNSELFETISGILIGFIAIPVFSIMIPVWLTRKWRLEHSFLPRNKNWLLVILILALYVILVNFESIKSILGMRIALTDFIIHYISTLLFHVTYYPLLVLFLFPILRKNFGLVPGIILTSLAFSLYHLVQFHFFPAGLTLYFQIMLFLSFTAQILFYLWGESLIFVALAHSTNGAIGLIVGGTIFNQIDFVFYLTIVIISFLFGYMIFQGIRDRKHKELDSNWWLNISIDK